MATIRADATIAATPGRVWSILTEFRSYPDWNPFIRSISGELREGAKLQVRIEPPGGRGMTFRPVLTTVNDGRELRWLGRVGLPRLFDGEHCFTIEPQAAGGVRFVQSEEFRGVLVPILSRMLRKTKDGFEQMNAALKARAESAA